MLWTFGYRSMKRLHSNQIAIKPNRYIQKCDIIFEKSRRKCCLSINVYWVRPDWVIIPVKSTWIIYFGVFMAGFADSSGILIYFQQNVVLARIRRYRRHNFLFVSIQKKKKYLYINYTRCGILYIRARRTVINNNAYYNIL